MNGIPDSHADILDKAGLAYLATAGPKGEPQVSPVWFGWDGRYLRVSHTPDRQKYRNVRRDPRVALAFNDPDDLYRHIEIRGRVERIDPDPDHAFINAMAKKYTGVDVYEAAPPSQERVILVIAPEHANTMG
ncbi:MAG TPA: PPOX class F420-dependent oxidoreductase [Actinomycetota bacterium]